MVLNIFKSERTCGARELPINSSFPNFYLAAGNVTSTTLNGNGKNNNDNSCSLLKNSISRFFGQ